MNRKHAKLAPVSVRACALGGLLALCFWSSHGRAGELQEWLEKSRAYAALPAVKHTPDFHLELIRPGQEGKRNPWYYICDGDRRIGAIGDDVQLFDKEADYRDGKLDNTCFADGARLCLTMGPYHTEILPISSRKLTVTNVELMKLRR